MTSLLDLEMHIFLLTWWLIQQMVTGQTQVSKLDMALNAFDDQYTGCVEDMDRKAPQLLEEEMNMNEELKNRWKKAEQRWKERKKQISYPKSFNDNYGIAVMAYTGKALYRSFNKAVREFNPKSKFHYKAFHYYLTRALQLLSNKKCNTVFRGSETRFSYDGKGNVRFGQFTSSSLDERKASDFIGHNGTLFIIETCLGVYVKEFSFYPGEEEVLIPVNEMYSKVIVEQRTNEKHNRITITAPQKMKSNFNCFYSSGTHKGPALLLLLLSGLLVQLLLPC